MDKVKDILRKKGKFIILGLLFILLILLLVLFFLSNGESDIDEPDTRIPSQPGAPLDPDDSQPPSVPELALVRQPLNYYHEYEINISQNVIQEVDRMRQEYPSFEILESDYIVEIESFLDAIGKGNLEYKKEAYIENFVIHSWTRGLDVVSYNVSRDFLSMEFKDAVEIPNVNFNPRDNDNLEESIEAFAQRYFSSNFKYHVDEVVMEGLLYRVSFRRKLDSLPVNTETVGEHILLTRDGRLKSGSFLLADFEENISSKYPLISGPELSRSISLLEYPKTINFFFIEPQEDIDYHDLIGEGVEKGNVNVNNFELVYYYSSRDQQVLVPIFLFEGNGTVVVMRRTIRSNFVIFASALEPDYVLLPPDSYFESLRPN
jgi:hypothetical protein